MDTFLNQLIEFYWNNETNLHHLTLYTTPCCAALHLTCTLGLSSQKVGALQQPTAPLIRMRPWPQNEFVLCAARDKQCST